MTIKNKFFVSYKTKNGATKSIQRKTYAEAKELYDRILKNPKEDFLFGSLEIRICQKTLDFYNKN